MNAENTLDGSCNSQGMVLEIYGPGRRVSHTDSVIRYWHKLILLFLLTLLAIPASWAADPLKLGIFPRRNAAITDTMFQPLAEYLSQHLERKVILMTSRDFKSFWEGVEEKRYDIVHLNQYQYVKAHQAFGYEVIAQNHEFGRDTLAGVLYVRKDSGIERVEQLRGRKILFGGGRSAFVSYIAIAKLLQDAGLKEGDYEAAFARNPPNAIIAAYLQQADAGAAGDIGIRLPIVKKQIDTSELAVLASSEQLPHIPWAVSSEVDESLKQRISGVLLELNDSEQGRAILSSAKLTGISEANDSDYEIAREMIRDITDEDYSVR